MTSLLPADELRFKQWLLKNNVPFDPSPNADYDMRGFWRGLVSGDPRALQGVNANDGMMHFSDTWKTPSHQSFSNESQWATPAAPMWNQQDQLVDRQGRIRYDERKPQPDSQPMLLRDLLRNVGR
jgi:hypothetical protein